MPCRLRLKIYVKRKDRYVCLKNRGDNVFDGYPFWEDFCGNSWIILKVESLFRWNDNEIDSFK